MPLRTYVQLFSVLILFILVLVLAWFVSRWFSGYTRLKGSGGNIEIIESFRLGTSQFIAIVRMGERYLALAVGKDNISVLTELSKDEISIRAPGEAPGGGFQEILKKLRKDQDTRGKN